MNTKLWRAAAAACVAGTVLCGCTADQDYLNARPELLGEATRQTFAAQIIDPNPEYATLVPATSGDHAVDAIDRYRTDTVKKPERQQTSNVGTQSGGK